MEQNSDAWLDWRKKGVGGSDAPIVMGLSPWSTEYELWEEKTGLVVRDQEAMKFITDKGHRLEPKARALYEIETGIICPPQLVQRADNETHRASLDGRNAELKKTVEIKFVGAGEKWEMALAGEIPDYYMAQMQWQLYCSGDETNDYVAYNEAENKIAIITVKPDLKFIKKMVKKVDSFWKKVVENKEPKLSDKDYKRVSSKEMKEALDRYQTIKYQIDDLTVLLNEEKDIIANHPRFNHRRMDHNGTKIMVKNRAGSIDYKKVIAEHLPELNLEGYRKPGTSYKEIKVVKRTENSDD